MQFTTLNPGKKRILVIGGGFGGIEFAQRIDCGKYEVLLIDKNNYFTFQPLLYQVATGGLEPDSIAYPIRKIFRRKKIFFRVAQVEEIVPESGFVKSSIGNIAYDFLVLATGSATNYFGQVELSRHAMPLKSVTDSLDLRSFILQNFELALLAGQLEERERLMHFVVVGGGPTGVEIAGALAELKKHVLPNDYPELDFSSMKITLIEAGERILSGMSEKTSVLALRQLEETGVAVNLKTLLKSYDGNVVLLGDGRSIETSSLIWAAGVKGNPILGFKAESVARGDRLKVDRYNRVSGYDNIFAIGDVAALDSPNEKPEPMLAPVAIQQAANLARNLNRKNPGEWKPFRYVNKGTMATIGRSRAVAEIKNFRMKGFIAWLAWLFVHLMLLVGFRNRIIVLINWMWNYFSYDRAIRLIIRPFKRP